MIYQSSGGGKTLGGAGDVKIWYAGALPLSGDGKSLLPRVPAAGGLRIENVRAQERDGALHVSYERSWGPALRQFVTVWSAEDERTVYLTGFRAGAKCEVELGPLFATRSRLLQASRVVSNSDAATTG